MNTVYVDSAMKEEERRRRLYEGQLFTFAPRPAALALCQFAQGMIEEAFGSLDPAHAQESMPVEQYVAIVAPLKPRFIHHPETKLLLKKVVEELGCDPDKTYIDVPRLRMVTHSGYLTAGVGYAHHLHRDTWYSAPMCQINWWLPIYDLDTGSSMAFHPKYWSQAVKNESSSFNYYEWNSVGRRNAAQFIKEDTRKQPHALEPLEREPDVRIVPKAGGSILFSGAQMHSTVPNTTGRARYSIDFRTVNYDDIVNRLGAANIDSECTGTSLRDFMRGSDFERFPEEVVAKYDSGKPVAGELRFQP